MRAHKDEHAFQTEFGKENEWRRQLNEWADEEAGKRAHQAQPLSPAVKVQYQDRITAQVIHHLAQRVEAALAHTDTKLVKKTIAKHRRKAAEEKVRVVGPNKKERMRRKADSPQAVEGHAWVIKDHKTNLTMKCSICGLYIESCKVGESFERLMAQPCIGCAGDHPSWPDLHPSHGLINKGCCWECSACGAWARPFPPLQAAVCAVT